MNFVPHRLQLWYWISMKTTSVRTSTHFFSFFLVFSIIFYLLFVCHDHDFNIWVFISIFTPSFRNFSWVVSISKIEAISIVRKNSHNDRHEIIIFRNQQIIFTFTYTYFESSTETYVSSYAAARSSTIPSCISRSSHLSLREIKYRRLS